MAILLRVHMFGLVCSYNSYKRLTPLNQVLFHSFNTCKTQHAKMQALLLRKRNVFFIDLENIIAKHEDATMMI